MEKAVDVAEKNMSRFGLTQQEIGSRRQWVLQTRRQVRSGGSPAAVPRKSCLQRAPGCHRSHDSAEPLGR